MADERDLELLDDYLSNRMSENDRLAFEQKLHADPDLQNELSMQKRLIQGIRDARVAELKAMLNKVPVPAGGPSTIASKIILGTVATLIIAVTVYWYTSREDVGTPAETAPVEVREEPGMTPPVDDSSTREQTLSDREQSTETDKNQTSAGTEHSKPSLARKPDPVKAPEEKADDKAERVPDVFVPGDDTVPEDEADQDDHASIRAATPSLAVETDRSNARYKFHYQFKGGKLYLYGPFEQNLYEILEIFSGDKRTVFLYYKDRYFRLEEVDSQVRPLDAITDASLLRKLKEYRASK